MMDKKSCRGSYRRRTTDQVRTSDESQDTDDRALRTSGTWPPEPNLRKSETPRTTGRQAPEPKLRTTDSLRTSGPSRSSGRPTLSGRPTQPRQSRIYGRPSPAGCPDRPEPPDVRRLPDVRHLSDRTCGLEPLYPFTLTSICTKTINRTPPPPSEG